jgi:transposase-like protein
MPAASVIADTEVRQQPVRRRFTADYKLRIIEEADRCSSPGQVGALLRREGLYSSHLVTWRRQRKEGSLKALAPRKRGPKEILPSPLTCEVEKLRRENKQLRERLSQAETIIEVQKKVSLLLQSPPSSSTE